MKSRSVFLGVILISIMCILGGCGDKEPPTYLEVNEYLMKRYGDEYEFVSKEEKTYDFQDKTDITVYKFKSEFGFDFEVESGLDYRDGVGGYSKFYDDNYYIKISDDLKSKVKKAAVRIGLNEECVSFGETLISVKAGNYDDISDINELFYEIYDIYSREFKIKDEVLKYIFIYLEKDGDEIYSGRNLKEINETDKKENLKYFEDLYLSN